jgi:hypothetical protein
LRGVPAISRYLVPITPLLVAYAFGAFAWLAASSRRRPGFAVVFLVLAGVVSIGISTFTWGRFVVPQAKAFEAGVEGTLKGLGRWCKAHTPPGTEIAIPDIGTFAYYADRPVVDLAGLVTPAITPLLRRYPYDDLVTNLRFEGVARPAYLIDRADIPRRMLFQSPYAPILTPLLVGRVDQRGITHPEPAYYTLYKIDWVGFDRMEGSVRQAEMGQAVSPILGASENRLSGIADSSSFRVVLDASDHWRFDSKEGTIEVRLAPGPDTTLQIVLTREELDSLKPAAIRLRIMDLPEPHPSTREFNIFIRPHTVWNMKVDLNGRSRTFHWQSEDMLDEGLRPVDSSEWKRLSEFKRCVDGLVRLRADWILRPQGGRG